MQALALVVDQCTDVPQMAIIFAVLIFRWSRLQSAKQAVWATVAS